MTMFSIQEYCAKNAVQAAAANAMEFPETTRHFLERLDLPTRHPFCEHKNVEDFFAVEGIPPMGSMSYQDESLWERLVTFWFMVFPPLLAMAELWLRLFAGALAPMGCLYLLFRLLPKPKQTTKKLCNDDSSGTWQERRNMSLVCLLTVASALVLMTDTYYVLNYGPIRGAVIFVVAAFLAMATCLRFSLSSATAVGLWLVVLLAIHLVWDRSSGSLVFGDFDQQVNISEGLYYDHSNAFIQSLVDNWPKELRTYSWATSGATPWMPSGDSRTGLPFLIHHWPSPQWYRVFLGAEEEYIALDIAFPPGGVQPLQPTYLILHGLNGGSSEEYIRDFTHRSINQGSTVVVMIARGLMDLPVRGWDIFHGARTSDAHEAARVLRKTLIRDQVLIGVGYSMGAIVLNNYVASYGAECALDGAIGISGGLDMRFQENFTRAQRLWQPMLAETLRSDFLLGKWGMRVHERLSKDDLLRMMRATHVTEIDKYAVVPYNGFRDLDDYYTSMSALGDIPLSTKTHDGSGLVVDEHEGNNNLDGKIHSVAIPFCVLHALDDPLVTWKATADNEGFMHPNNLVRTGSGYLMILFTKAGGHVGWPLGVFPFRRKWKWMSNVATSFGQAVAATISTSRHNNEEQGEGLCTNHDDERRCPHAPAVAGAASENKDD